MSRVLGVDPGLRLTGWGFVDVAGVGVEPTLVEAGVVRLDSKRSVAERLVELEASLGALIDEYRPAELAVEKVYSHYKHPQTAVIMGHARGVILFAAQKRGLAVHDVPSTEVKKALTGYGHASKAQVQRAVAAQLGLAEPPSPEDVADALAIALTHGRRVSLSA
ncbi:MAG: crossover junction endodeoxyribonuclease RuvC [Planctomycetota bacterium]